MVSPYLQRPIRTLKQAQRDRARVRNRQKAAVSTVHALPGTTAGQLVDARLPSRVPRNREAA